MNIRSINSAYSMKTTSDFAAQKALDNTGGIFVGGRGMVGVSNSTTGFQCAGGEATMFLVNRGEGAQIQAGTGAIGGIAHTNVKGEDIFVNNKIISVGNNCKIFGTEDDDVIFSLGQSCDIKLGGGNDEAFVSGTGSKVDGEAGDDVISGTPAGLNYAKLMDLDPVSMLAEIYKNSANIVYKSFSKANA